MIKETVFFLRHGPATSRRQAEMGPVEFQKWLAKEVDKAGQKALREELVQDLRGDILEVGAGAGAMFSYYDERANVVALEPDDDFRAAATEAAMNAPGTIQVVGGAGESLRFPDASFDAIVASTRWVAIGIGGPWRPCEMPASKSTPSSLTSSSHPQHRPRCRCA